MKKIFSVFSKIFFFPGKIMFPLFLFGSGSKRNSSVLMAKSILANSSLRKSGEFIFSLIIWGLVISCFFPSCDGKKVSKVGVEKTTEVKHNEMTEMKTIENIDNEKRKVAQTNENKDVENSGAVPVVKKIQYQNGNKELQQDEKRSVSTLQEVMEKMKQNASKTKSAHFDDEPEYLK